MPARTALTPPVPTASMADVAFLLLVFFLIAAAMRSDVGIPSLLPPSSPEAARVVPGGRLALSVSASGAVALDGEALPAEALRRRVGAWARPGGVVVVRAHREAPYAAYIAALDAVLLAHRDAGVEPRLALPQVVQ